MFKTRTKTEVVKKVEENDSLYCDACGKLIAKDICNTLDFQKNKKIPYIEVTTGHHDWGSDSGDSVVRRDFCIDCGKQQVDILMTALLPECNSEYLEVEKEYVIGVEDETHMDGHYTKSPFIQIHGTYNHGYKPYEAEVETPCIFCKTPTVRRQSLEYGTPVCIDCELKNLKAHEASVFKARRENA